MFSKITPRYLLTGQDDLFFYSEDDNQKILQNVRKLKEIIKIEKISFYKNDSEPVTRFKDNADFQKRLEEIKKELASSKINFKC